MGRAVLAEVLLTDRSVYVSGIMKYRFVFSAILAKHYNPSLGSRSLKDTPILHTA
jgi:hypothetical protein